MENAPETKPECSCCCSGKKSAAPVIVVLLIAVIAVVAAIFIFNNKPLPQYAPEGTDAIAAVNGRAIAKTKVFQAFKKTLNYEEAAEQAKKEGISLDQAIQGEMCFFVDSSDDAPVINSIYRGQGGVAEKIFASVKKDMQKNFEGQKKLAAELGSKAPDFSADKIDGKEAFVSRSNGGAVILLDKNTFQTSFGKGDKLIAAPFKAAKATALTQALDPKALISVAYKVELPKSVKEMLASEDAAQYRDLHAELNMVKVNIYDAGEDLELKVTGEYKTAAAAGKAAKQLDDLYKQANTLAGAVAGDKDTPAEIKEAVEVLKAIKIESKDKQVVISLKYSQAKLVKLIEEQDKKSRELKKQMEEEIKNVEAMDKKVEAKPAPVQAKPAPVQAKPAPVEKK